MSDVNDVSESTKYWFPTKRYGWGWGLPSAWQGWVVLAGFVALLLVGTQLFPPEREAWTFTIYTFILSGGLLAICVAKGEPPRWRWGKLNRAHSPREWVPLRALRGPHIDAHPAPRVGEGSVREANRGEASPKQCVRPTEHKAPDGTQSAVSPWRPN
ncbi:MAG: hypothetical protein U0470_10275 [Anaerolineae bacterium]